MNIMVWVIYLLSFVVLVAFVVTLMLCLHRFTSREAEDDDEVLSPEEAQLLLYLGKNLHDYVVDVEQHQGYTQPVTLSVSGVPAGATSASCESSRSATTPCASPRPGSRSRTSRRRWRS